MLHLFSLSYGFSLLDPLFSHYTFFLSLAPSNYILIEPRHVVREAGVFRVMNIADSLKGEIVMGNHMVWDRLTL